MSIIDKIDEKNDLYLVSFKIRNSGIEPIKSHLNKICFALNPLFILYYFNYLFILI